MVGRGSGVAEAGGVALGAWFSGLSGGE